MKKVKRRDGSINGWDDRDTSLDEAIRKLPSYGLIAPGCDNPMLSRKEVLALIQAAAEERFETDWKLRVKEEEQGHSSAEARREVLDAIAHYRQHGNCWLSIVTFIGIRNLFGGFEELLETVRPYKRRQKEIR